ncbi:MAG: spore germination protein [Oscillospiraceae bacterium]|jgi:hypothetical protein|nr:spore germination protein [Oscillospiraceae bacterium]
MSIRGRFEQWIEAPRKNEPLCSEQSRFDISKEYNQPVFTGSGGYEKNLDYIKALIGINEDIFIREISLPDGRKASVVMVEGMYDKRVVEQTILFTVKTADKLEQEEQEEGESDISQLFSNERIVPETSLSKSYLLMLSGDPMLVAEYEPTVFNISSRYIVGRGVEQSPNEGSIRAPHESFCETLRLNTALLRKRVSDPNLTIENMSVGLRSHTAVCVCYITGVTNMKIVEDVKERIRNVNTDIVGDAGKLEQLIEENPYSIFPEYDGSELPDKVAGALCEGRVIVMADGSPFALILPTTLLSMLQVNEDNYHRWSYTILVKVLRILGVLISIYLPSLYICAVSFNSNILPLELLIFTYLNRISVPFVAVVEILLLEGTMEFLREANTRMPSKIGTALSIVGGIIIGDATIRAGIVSPLPIIVVALSTIASYVIPACSLSNTFRLIKYFQILMSASLGLFGFHIGVIITVSQLAVKESFGASFLAPVSPIEKKTAFAYILQLPTRLRNFRPKHLNPIDHKSS